MITELMALVKYSPYEVGMCLSVVTYYEKRRFYIFLLEDIQDLRCVFGVGPIVKRQCDLTRSVAGSLNHIRRRNFIVLFSVNFAGFSKHQFALAVLRLGDY